MWFVGSHSEPWKLVSLCSFGDWRSERLAAGLEVRKNTKTLILKN
jgi:hypothetical protein